MRHLRLQPQRMVELKTDRPVSHSSNTAIDKLQTPKAGKGAGKKKVSCGAGNPTLAHFFETSIYASFLGEHTGQADPPGYTEGSPHKPGGIPTHRTICAPK